MAKDTHRYLFCQNGEEIYTPHGVRVVRMYLKYSISGVLYN
jgi:hypothetical protein